MLGKLETGIKTRKLPITSSFFPRQGRTNEEILFVIFCCNLLYNRNFTAVNLTPNPKILTTESLLL